jgi:transcriptional regulator with XRE-family HTH domain
VPAKEDVAPIDRALAAILKGAYKTQGLTQEDLVARTGITKTTMRRLMAGQSSFGVEQMFDISDAIGWKTAREYLAEAEEKLAANQG